MLVILGTLSLLLTTIVFFCDQCGPRSDSAECTARSGVYTVYYSSQFFEHQRKHNFTNFISQNIIDLSAMSLVTNMGKSIVLMQVLDGEIFERIQEYFAVYGNTAQEISCYENRSFNRIVEHTAMVSRT